MREVIWLVAMLAFCILTGCDTGPVEPNPGEGEIDVIDPVSHPNAGAPVGVVYFRIRNNALSPDRLIRVETPAASKAELHETIANGDLMRMVHRPDGFEVSAGGELVFESGGKHVMLTGLVAQLKEGSSIELDLVFERAGAVRAVVPIRPRAY